MELLEYKHDNQKEKWVEEWFQSAYRDAEYNRAIEDILVAFKDNTREKQIRHYIVSLCSHKDENTIIFCDGLLKTYLAFRLLSLIENKLEPLMDKWTEKFYHMASHHTE